MHKGGTRLSLQLATMLISFIIGATIEHHIRAVFLGCRHLREGSAFWHDNRTRSVILSGGNRDTLGMIASGSGDDTGIELFLAQARNLIGGSSRFKRAATLHMFGLEINIGSGHC